LLLQELEDVEDRKLTARGSHPETMSTPISMKILFMNVRVNNTSRKGHSSPAGCGNAAHNDIKTEPRITKLDALDTQLN
jgi:hypothetical protein